MISSHSRKTAGLDLTAIRARLAGEAGPRYWRSLEELADSEDFRRFLAREFPSQVPEWTDPVSRRTFLGLMGASLALAGVSGCSPSPAEKIVPYVRLPEQIVPGRPLQFASAIALNGYGTGVLVESHMGRPTMIEGNEKHPDSLGAVDPFVQASLLTLYDPDRSQVVLNKGEISTWDAFLNAALPALDVQRPSKGTGLRILSGSVTSPTLARQIQAVLDEFPAAKWHQYEPAASAWPQAGARLAFGKDVATRYHVDRADVILSLDADFLGNGPGHLRAARQFAARRETLDRMNRLYVVESSPTVTGSVADHRLPLTAHRVAGFAQFVARAVEAKLASVRDGGLPAAQEVWARALARDLRKHKGSSLVVAGTYQPPIVHALAHAMNEALGNVGTTVVYSDPIEEHPVDPVESLRELIHDIDGSKVDVLLILGGNPAYAAPADFSFGTKLAKVRLSAYLGLYGDETAALCGWQLPEAHELEAWGDVRGSDGTVTVQQPLIAPLYDGRSAIELLAALRKHPARTGYEIVRETWKGDRSAEAFETYWRTAVHDGLIAGTERAEVKAAIAEPLAAPPAAEGTGLELVFRPDPTVWDGRFANNGWLQELPKPLSKLTWDNAALLSPATAERLKLSNGDVVELRYAGQTIDAPVWVMPGQADDSVTIHLGYGRTRAGKVGTGRGFNAYALRTSAAPWFGFGLEVVRKAGHTYELATTQHHRSLEGRDLLRAGTIDEYRKHPDFAQERHKAKSEEEHPSPADSLYPEIEGSHSRLDHKSDGQPAPAGHAWGMVVNLNACNGCGACVIACQAENNIPIVGKEEIAFGREMHWIDLDCYYHGSSLENPQVLHQPRFCMQCENAPCEVVCPVGATVHDAEGINNMVYNRCVGTRYCGNNCPYKVRHFNFFDYAKPSGPSLELLNNPDVTVRARGVMEKCTYCIQRINGARYESEREDRPLRDGDIVTACQAACPTRAILFGDINDPDSRVSKQKDDPRNYGMLAELNTRPRTTYLAKLWNPNPELGKEPHHGD